MKKETDMIVENAAESTGAETDAGYQSYIRRVIKIGTIAMLVLLLLTFLPALYLCIFHEGFPGFGTLAAAFTAMLGVEGFYWFVEPTMYFPIVGIAGLYLCYTAGNITSMRIPAANAAQNTVDAKIGTHKSEVAGILGIIASVVVNFIVLLLVILFGNYLLSVLPATVLAAFDYALPAVYGSLVVVMLLRVIKK